VQGDRCNRTDARTGHHRPAAYADLILFDAATIGITGTRRVADLPNGAVRLLRSATGLKTVWVNGSPIFSDGEYCMGRPSGHVLGRFATTKPRVGMAV
jgi:hypothetical protein